MRRTARQSLATLMSVALLLLAAGAPNSVRANGFAQQADTWVATSGTPTGTNAGTSCANPGFVVDGTNDEVEIGYAILDVLAGGTVHLCAGSYHVSTGLGFNKDFTLAGAGMGNTFVLGTAEFLESGDYSSGGSEFLFDTATSNLTVRDLTIRGFYGDGYGALYGNGFVLDRVRMDHNGNLDSDGGAIWGDPVVVRNSVIADNYAAGDGGAISTGDLTVERTQFLRNHAAENGGAFDASGTIRLWRSDFIDNVAMSQGGAGWTHSSSTVTIDHARFRGNSATASHGGALRLYQSTSAVLYSTFVHNTAGQAGGAIDAYQGSLRILSSRFDGNYAGTNGGAVVSWEQSSLKVERSIWRDNIAESETGGALKEHASAVPPVIRYNIFARNRAIIGAGGAISVDAGDLLGGSGPNLLGITNNTFRGNRAPSGHAIQVYQCESPSAASIRTITWRNHIVRAADAAGQPRVRLTTVVCDPPG